jgi:uncharacterized membrane protein
MSARLARFVGYGLLGWGVEIVWTALSDTAAGRQRGWRLEGRTFLWMFPIYGLLEPLYEPLHDALRPRPWPLRALAYALGFLTVEYATGWLLRRLLGACPWDYAGRSRYQVRGLVRLDYAPLWALLGLALEPVHDRLARATGQLSS